MSRHTNARAIAKLEALYARLPTVECRGLCAVACGPIMLSRLEADRLRRADPGRRLPMATPAARCIYLTNTERCRVYAVRPLICRVWGTLKRFSCFHGCIPSRWLSDHEFVAIAQAVERLGGGTVTTTPEGLTPGRSFFELDISRTSPAAADRLAEITRVARALHGGYVVGVAPGNGEWIDLDDLKKER